jgi:hypothetical protein
MVAGALRLSLNDAETVGCVGAGCAGAPAATEAVILGSGPPRAEPARSGPAVAVIHNGGACPLESGSSNDSLLAERIHAVLVSGVEQVEMELRRKMDETMGNGSVCSPGGETVPQGYADAVAEYSRKLSKSK